LFSQATGDIFFFDQAEFGQNGAQATALDLLLGHGMFELVARNQVRLEKGFAKSLGHPDGHSFDGVLLLLGKRCQ
jgi:hypothetical protein